MATLHAQHLNADIDQYLSTAFEKMADKNVVSNPQESIVENDNSIVENIVENENSIVENIIEKLPETQSQIVRIILATPSVTTKEIANTLSIAQRNVQNHIRKLKERGIIRRVGPDKGGFWEIIIKNE